MEETDEKKQNTIVKSETASDLELYKKNLGERFVGANNPDERKEVLELREKIQKIEEEHESIKRKAFSENVSLIYAILFSIFFVFVLFYQQTNSTAAICFLTLCLKRLLQSQLKEIGNLFNSLTKPFSDVNER